jgi:ABC-type sugar transport system ATPase subunit
MRAELLRVDEASGSYIEKKVLNRFFFEVYEGETVCLFGLNGSGKTSFMRLMLGMNEGKWSKRAYYRDVPVNLQTRADAATLGIHCVFKETTLVEKMTVAENLNLLGKKPLELIRRQRDAIVQAMLDNYGLSHIGAFQNVRNLDAVEKYLLEMVRAAGFDARILFIDCMEFFVSTSDISRLKALLHRMNAVGISVVFLCNKLDARLMFADRMIIMRDGMRVKEFVGSTHSLEDVYAYASGSRMHHPEHARQRPSVEQLPEVMAVRHLWAGDYSVSFAAQRGRILGIHCAEESVLTQLAMQFLRGKLDCWQCQFDGQLLAGHRLRRALRRHLVTVQGLQEQNIMFGNLSILENIMIGSRRLSAGPLHLVRSDLARVVGRENSDLIDRAQTMRINNALNPVLNMEILAKRLLLQKAWVVVMDRPFLGLDAVSCKAVAERIGELAARGISLVLLSQDCRELAQLGGTVAYMQKRGVAQ